MSLKLINQKNISLIVQDYRTFKVLGIKQFDEQEIKKLKINSYFNLNLNQKNINKDQFIIKEILKDEEELNYLIKVKINKESKNFTNTTQFNELNKNPYSYLRKLEAQIEKIISEDIKHTQINSIIKKGTPKIAKKFGEEAVELVIESGKFNDDLFINEAADVFYYYIILLHERGFELGQILECLKKQKRKN